MLNAMFPGIIPRKFSISFNNNLYFVSESVGHYFSILNIQDLKQSSSSFTIHYNKTTISQVKKQPGIKIRFWLERDSAVKVHNLKEYLMGHASGVLLAENNEIPCHNCSPLKVMIQMLIQLSGIK